MRSLHKPAAVVAVCLALMSGPAAADNAGTALKVVGIVVTAVGVWTGNPELMRWGWVITTGGDACGRTAAVDRIRRRRKDNPEDEAQSHAAPRAVQGGAS